MYVSVLIHLKRRSKFQIEHDSDDNLILTHQQMKCVNVAHKSAQLNILEYTHIPDSSQKIVYKLGCVEVYARYSLIWLRHKLNNKTLSIHDFTGNSATKNSHLGYWPFCSCAKRSTSRSLVTCSDF